MKNIVDINCHPRNLIDYIIRKRKFIITINAIIDSRRKNLEIKFISLSYNGHTKGFKKKLSKLSIKLRVRTNMRLHTSQAIRKKKLIVAEITEYLK